MGKAGSEADRDINLNNTVPRTLCLYQIPDALALESSHFLSPVTGQCWCTLTGYYFQQQ